MEALIDPKTVRQSIYEFSDELLNTLTEAAAANSQFVTEIPKESGAGSKPAPVRLCVKTACPP